MYLDTLVILRKSLLSVKWVVRTKTKHICSQMLIIENREGSQKWIIVCKKRVKVPLSAHNVFATSELLYHVKKSREEDSPMEWVLLEPKPQQPNNFWMRAKNSDFLTRLPAYGATPHSSTLVLYSSDLGANWQRIYGGLRHRKILAQRRADDYYCKFKFRYHQTPILWRDTPAKISWLSSIYNLAKSN